MENPVHSFRSEYKIWNCMYFLTTCMHCFENCSPFTPRLPRYWPQHGRHTTPVQVATMAGKLRACMTDTEFLSRRIIWKEWYSSSHYFVLEDNLKRFRSLGITPQGINRQLARDQEPPWDSKTNWSKAQSLYCTQFLSVLHWWIKPRLSTCQ